MGDNGKIIIPEDVKQTEEPKEVTLFKAVMLEGNLGISINDAVQLRDISHAMRILSLMLDARISGAQMKENLKKVQPVKNNFLQGIRNFKR